MVSRLVLGWGSTGHAIVNAAADGGGPVHVVTDDSDLIETLREGGIPATEGDPGSPWILRDFDDADLVLVASEDPTKNCTIASAARAAIPDAILVTYTGKRPTEAQLTMLSGIADHVLDDVEVLAHRVLTVATNPASVRARRLRSLLASIEGTLCVFMHSNPDPDAIASAVGLVTISESVGTDAEAYYFGDITHQENMAFVNLLDLDLYHLDADDELPECDAIALVDHANPGINDLLPQDTTIDVIVDHHAPSGPIDATFVDLRENVGATSTIIVEYMTQLEIDVDPVLATALLYGIQTDTRNFSRTITSLDFESASHLLEAADPNVLDRIENPNVSRETLSTVARAIRNREVRGTVLATCVGQVRDRDALAQAADLLLQMEGIKTTLVYGFDGEVVYASARTRGSSGTVDLGSVMRDAYGQIGNAGGHAEMAGAQIPLGILGGLDEEAEDRLIDVVSEVLNDRFFETVETHTPYVATRIEERARTGSARAPDNVEESF